MYIPKAANYIRNIADYARERVDETHRKLNIIIRAMPKVVHDSLNDIVLYLEYHNNEKERLYDTMLRENEYLIIIHAVLGHDWWKFIRFKIYRTAMVKLWRAKCNIYHTTRYNFERYITVSSYKLLKSIHKITDPVKILEVKSGIPFLLSKKEKLECMFPIEIWLMISELDVNKANLIRVNRTLFRVFVQDVYEDLTMALTISSLEKVKMNDECYLKYGPDFYWSWTDDSYPVYLRNKEYQDCDYEFVDIRQPKKDGENRSNQYDSIISNPKAIELFFINIMEKPDSIIKRYIKNVTVSIHFLHGFENLIRSEKEKKKGPWNISISLFSEFRKNKDVFFTQGYSQKFYSKAVFDKFNSDRWEMPTSVLRERLLSYPNFDITNLQRTFPHRVYFKELVGINVILGYFQNTQKKQLLRSATCKKEFKETNPFDEYHNTLISRYGEEPGHPLQMMQYMDRVVENELDDPMKLEIRSRFFYTEIQAKNMITRISSAICSTKMNKKVNCSLLVSAQLGEGDRSEHSIDHWQRGGGFNFASVTSYTPYTILINKPVLSSATALWHKKKLEERQNKKLMKKNKA